ncbi:LysR substrate-binding domain-containing protein [Azospirillum rugosum]|uniref:DNA-binding transcriptional LysR family regulator n=1 Tax=Azospirillum rugosum TaxID=416170 RepID=A0ABS4SGM1_9PROT|nr:LysR substrate-binding domain-containing protein [Azospirillum rugosum]MBP2291657.1 DNA-binding transcriptional LysR family regulator [Azospirillum rugosum]MDQ0524531.1 DNA-binding transcriptional LysR family regulator [Azospirillum rugosum]
MRDMDLGLLRTFVSVVDAGGFTRGGERVHKTQSTVSQQIRRLEEQVGLSLLDRNSRTVLLTDDGERLLGYARRLLALNDEAHSVLSGRKAVEVVRLGVPEDYAVERLPRLLADFARQNRQLRLDVRCDLSVRLRADVEAGDLDLALVKQEPGHPGARAAWREPLCWIGPADHDLHREDPLPLVVFPQGCVYRNRAVHELERAGRPWRVAYSSPNHAGVRAAVAGGLGVSVLPRSALPPGARFLDEADGLPLLPETELALLVGTAMHGDGAALVARLLSESLPEPVWA